MKEKDLLSQLSRMEQSLHNFSFEELTSDEATQLKKAFETFREKLENKIFQPNESVTHSNPDHFHEESRLPQETDTENIDSNMLIARVSHEIRTPLNGIIGFTDLLKEDEALNNRQLGQVNAIQKTSYSLLEIINELLEYCKLSAGVETFEVIDFNFRNVVGDVIYLCNTLVSAKNVNLKVEIDTNVPKALKGDPSKLTQVLLNLIGNAIKFVEEGSIELVVQAKPDKESRTNLTFKITDTGIGISKENLKHIFGSFRQAETNTHQKYGGSGLGLNIVKQIIERLGGTIAVTSELGVGTTFEFSMPFELGSLKNITKGSNTEISTKEKSIVKGMQILVFEDNIMNQKLIDQRLKTWSCQTYITDNAQNGLNILASHRIDLILMDLKLPGMSGFEITKLIRSFEKPDVQPIPIIALSADFSARDKEECEESGIDDFILKPYNSHELLQKLIENKKDSKGAHSIASKSTKSKRIENKEDRINLDGLLAECMGQLELLQELVILHKKGALEFIGNVRVHLNNTDIEQIGFAAHKIKPGLKMMQSKRLFGIVEQIQKCCHSDSDIKQLQFLYKSFLEEYPKAENAINVAMKELRRSKR